MVGYKCYKNKYKKKEADVQIITHHTEKKVIVEKTVEVEVPIVVPPPQPIYVPVQPPMG